MYDCNLQYKINDQPVMPRRHYEEILNTFDLNPFIPTTKKLRGEVTKKMLLDALRKEISLLFLGLNSTSSLGVTSWFANLNKNLIVTRINIFKEIPSHTEYSETKEAARRTYIKSLHTAPNIRVYALDVGFPVHIPIETLQSWAEIVFGETGIISFYEEEGA